MVAVGVLTPDAAARHISLDTLLLLLGTMLLSAHLSEAGFFGWAADAVIRRSSSAADLLRTTVFASGLLSALLVNDTVCVMLAPLLVEVVVRSRLPAAPFLLALATGSNIGSAMTLTGNPQNMIIGARSGMGWLWFLLHMAPGTLAALWVNWRLLRWAYGAALPAGPLAAAAPAGPPAEVNRPLLIKTLAALAALVAGFCVLPAAYLGWTALGGATLLLLLVRRDPAEVFARVDWPLLVFFAALFVLIGGIEEVGLTARAFAAVSGWFTDDAGGRLGFSLFSLIGSNLFSNVPFVMVVGRWIPGFADPELMWMILALTSTLAGNLTLIGSVANIIVAESARRHYALGFAEHLRFGLPSTLVTTAVALAGLAAVRMATAGN